ncbi:hypothetical protein, partial [Streptomyces chartreusis]|uniref:hypothetical protein n=1 Tax=Streptomyces chartreusis TaxID=1969 RepID=UPI0037F49E91
MISGSVYDSFFRLVAPAFCAISAWVGGLSCPCGEYGRPNASVVEVGKNVELLFLPPNPEGDPVRHCEPKGAVGTLESADPKEDGPGSEPCGAGSVNLGSPNDCVRGLEGPGVVGVLLNPG